MGSQQMLLLILGVIVIAIAIAVGVILFGGQSLDSNKTALLHDLEHLAADAAQYRLRPVSLDGGGNSYVGYVVPERIDTNDNGYFGPSIPVSTPDVITFTAVSALGYGTITVVCDKVGKLASFTYTGDFH
jgi:uncharacterized membrane protein YccC